MNIGILGTGDVATNLAAGLSRAGHAIKLGSRDPSKAKVPTALGKSVSVGTLAAAAAFGDVVIVAVPFPSVKETIERIGANALRGKIVVDATNVLSPSYDWALGFTTSGAEELAKLVPSAKVVKAFNHQFAPNMATGLLAGQRLLCLVAADDAQAKRVVMDLAAGIGFRAVDAGPLKSARYLEAMGMQLIQLGYGVKMGTAIGYAFVRDPGS
ncbi:MAG: NADPH-dependent F420 reductase [Euryarchaeota archaeon]|nr:NADPH-dependent F420 reductase [Euryarchaeota archaeon]